MNTSSPVFLAKLWLDMLVLSAEYVVPPVPFVPPIVTLTLIPLHAWSTKDWVVPLMAVQVFPPVIPDI